MILKLNLGRLNRTLRIVAGPAWIGLAATDSVGAWGWTGLLLLLTGVLGFCPACPLLGMNTCPMKTA